MKLQQQSHATLKSKLQDHKTTEESILMSGEEKMSHFKFYYFFFQFNYSLRATRRCNSDTQKKQNTTYFILVALLLAF